MSAFSVVLNAAASMSAARAGSAAAGAEPPAGEACMMKASAAGRAANLAGISRDKRFAKLSERERNALQHTFERHDVLGDAFGPLKGVNTGVRPF